MVTWGTNIGPSADLDNFAQVVEDFNTVVQLGQRWGEILTRAAASRDLWSRIAEDPGELVRRAEILGLPSPTADDPFLDPTLYARGIWAYPWTRVGLANVDVIAQTIVDSEIAPELGIPPRLLRVRYENPLEIAIVVSVGAVGGVLRVLRMIRDWRADRRRAAARASKGEAEARLQNVKADMAAWLLEEAKAGRGQVSPGELYSTIGEKEARAITHLASRQTRVQAPVGYADDGDGAPPDDDEGAPEDH